MSEEELYDMNRNYFYLYQDACREIERLRERINYPKIKVGNFPYSYETERIYVDMLLGDGITSWRQQHDVNPMMLKRNAKLKEYIIDYVLKEMGYKYLKKAYIHWQTKENNQ